MKHICAVIYICAVKCNAKTKKKFRFLRLCRVLWPRHSAKQTQFAECYHQDTRRKDFFKKNQILFEKCLPSVWQFNTRHMFSICRVQHSATRNSKNQKYFLKKLVAECLAVWHSAKSLLTAGLALWLFLFAESQTAHGKMFAECPINGTRQSWLCRNCL